MTERQRRRTQEERRAETRSRVIDAATRLIAQTGSRAVTLAQVGEAAGFSRGIVYSQFGNRERLLEAVLDEAQAIGVQADGHSGLEQLVALVEGYVRSVDERTPLARAFLQLWGEAVAADPVLAPIFAQRDREFRQYVADVVRAGVTDGSVRDEADPEAAAVVLVALVRGVGLQMIADPPVRELAAIVAEAGRAIRAAFGPAD